MKASACGAQTAMKESAACSGPASVFPLETRASICPISTADSRSLEPDVLAILPGKMTSESSDPKLVVRMAHPRCPRIRAGGRLGAPDVQDRDSRRGRARSLHALRSGLGDYLLIGHEALCWLVRRGYAVVRSDYPPGTWQRS